MNINDYVSETDREQEAQEQEQTRHNRHYPVSKATRESINKRLYNGLNHPIPYDSDNHKVNKQSRTEEYRRCYK